MYLSPTEAKPRPSFYSLLVQNYEPSVTLHIRTIGEPGEVFGLVQRAVREVDPILMLTPPVPLRQVLDRSVGDQRMMARRVSIFGGIAAALALIGLDSVMAHLVMQRRSEIGVRLALGAQPRAIVRLVLGQGVWLVAIGVPIGRFGALAASRYVRSQLFGIEPSDPFTLAGVSILFLVIAAAACLVPARRAVRVDPTIAVRA